MLVQDNKSSYPGFNDHFVKYEGTVSTMPTYYGAYGEEAWYEFKIYTEILNNLFVNIICYQCARLRGDTDTNNLPTNIVKSFALPFKVELNTGTDRTLPSTLKNSAIVVIRVPPSCIVSYKLSGIKSKSSYLPANREVVETPSAETVGFEGYGHTHDGRDSAKILVSNLQPNLGNNGKFLRSDADSSAVVYSDPTGAPGLFSLLLPADKAIINLTSGVQTAFTWEDPDTQGGAATDFTLIIVNERYEEVYSEVTGLVFSWNVPHSTFETNRDYVWYVVAVDAGGETTSSNSHQFRTSDISI